MSLIYDDPDVSFVPLVVAGTLISTTWCWHVVLCVFVSGGTKSGSCGWEHDAVWGALALTENTCFVFFFFVV